MGKSDIGLTRHLNQSEDTAISCSELARYVGDEIPMDQVYEKRIQAIIFISVINWVSDHSTETKLTDATFTKQRRSVFSREIHNEVKEWLRRPTFPNGRGQKVYKYETRTVEAEDIKSMCGENLQDAIDLVDLVIDEIGTEDRDKLMRWCTEQDEVKNLSSGDKIVF